MIRTKLSRIGAMVAGLSLISGLALAATADDETTLDSPASDELVEPAPEDGGLEETEDPGDTEDSDDPTDSDDPSPLPDDASDTAKRVRAVTDNRDSYDSGCEFGAAVSAAARGHESADSSHCRDHSDTEEGNGDDDGDTEDDSDEEAGTTRSDRPSASSHPGNDHRPSNPGRGNSGR